jgi:hypothetical protein
MTAGDKQRPSADWREKAGNYAPPRAAAEGLEPFYQGSVTPAKVPSHTPGPVLCYLRYRTWDIQRVAAAIERDVRGKLDTGAWVHLDRATRLGAPHRMDGAEHVGIGGAAVATAKELSRLCAAERGPLVIEAGANSLPMQAMARAADIKNARVTFDPLGAWARDGVLPSSLNDLYGEARLCEPMVLVSTLPYHNAGCSEVQEVAYALATAAEYLRDLAEGGVFAGPLHFRIGIGTNIFVEIAKLRALAWCWSKMAKAANRAVDYELHAVTSLMTASSMSPWTNSLRCTAAAFAAQCGGASSFSPIPFDLLHAEPSTLGQRIARNASAVLQYEGHLGHVDDPAAGAGYVEALTESLARAAWLKMQEIERAGGMSSQLAAGHVRGEVNHSWEREMERHQRDTVLVGVNRFALEGDALAPRFDEVDLEAVAARFAIDEDSESELELDGIQAVIDAARGGCNFDQLSEGLRRGYAAAIEPMPDRRLPRDLGWESE